MPALFTLPHLAQLPAGEFDRTAEVASTAAFAATTAGPAAAVLALVRRHRRTAALATATIGGFAIAQLTTTMLVLINGALINGARPTGNPWLAYWVSMLPYRGWSEGSGSDAVLVLFDIVIRYPALYTFCLSFLLTFCFRTGLSYRPVREAVACG